MAPSSRPATLTLVASHWAQYLCLLLKSGHGGRFPVALSSLHLIIIPKRRHAFQSFDSWILSENKATGHIEGILIKCVSNILLKNRIIPRH